MGAVKQWLIVMEEAAESAIHDGLGERDALEFMGTVMAAAGLPTTSETLKEVYDNVKNPDRAVSF
jgi:hypothetical protein